MVKNLTMSRFHLLPMSRMRFARTKGYSFAARDHAGERKNDETFSQAFLKSLATRAYSNISSKHHLAASCGRRRSHYILDM